MAALYSYDFQNVVRSVMAEYEVMRAKMPSLISLVRVGAPARAHKEEWIEDQLAITTTTIASFLTDGDGVTFNVASASHLNVGDILRFESAAGAARSELSRVTVISTNTVTISRDFAGSPGVTLVVGDVVYIQSRPLGEATEVGTGDAKTEGTTNYNYTQIIDRTAIVSRTSIQSSHYGVGDLVNQQVGRHIVDLLREQNDALIYGWRNQRTSAANPGVAGGLAQFLNGGNAITTGGAIGKGHLNDALRSIFDDGGYSSEYAIVCAPNQAQKISAFNTTGSNPVVQYAPDGTTTGGYISKFVGDLPVQNGFMANVVVEPNAPRDAVYVVDMAKIEMAYLQELTDVDATPEGFDGVKRRILGEFTFRVQDGARAHAKITGLTI